MSTTSTRLSRPLLACLASSVLLMGCQSVRSIDLNPFDQSSRRVADTGPELIQVENTAIDDGREYPVRQPPPEPRDGVSAPDNTRYNGQSIQQAGSSPVKLRDDAPQQYTVVKGDTLWDISGLFLQDPWHWPEIWQVNPQIQNPHLIYPGDVLSLVWVDGQPRIVLNQQSINDRMSPKIRVLALDQAIPTIPYDAIAGFLSKPRVMSADQIKQLPYVLEIKDNHIVAGSGFTVYTRGGNMRKGDRYSVMNVGEPLRDPETNRVLGFETHHVGGGRIVAEGDPAKLFLNETTREVLRGDRLVDQIVSPAQDFVPSAPRYVIEGSIMSVLDGVSLVSQYQIVVLNRGAKHGLESGNVLDVHQRGDVIRDRYAERSLFSRTIFAPKVKLPNEKAGRLLVFSVDEDISYGLIMSATNEIKVGDVISNPN